jgi:hypothetical protein
MPRVFDLIKPLDNRDTYAITDVVFQKGGLREVESMEAMYAISTERRTNGMISFIIETGEFYSLTGGDLTNDSWEKIDFSPNIIGTVSTKELIIQENDNSISNISGENLSLEVLNTSILKVKNGLSISTLTDNNVQDGKLLFLQNLSENNISIKNDYLKSLNSFNNIINDQNGLKQIAFNGDVYVMVSSDGFLLKSEDLENWENIPDIDSNSWESIVQNNSIFIAVSSDGDNRVLFSTDGAETWTHVSVELYDWKSITYKQGLFLAVAESKAMYSVDGLEWTYIDLPDKMWKQVVYGKDVFVAITETIDGIDDMIYSDDSGVTWNTITKPNTNILSKIVFFVNDKFYAITDQNVIQSINGEDWENLVLPFDDSGINEVIYTGGYYIFIKTNIVYYTSNFEIWHEY